MWVNPVEEEKRLQWEARPLEGVGPLNFGMPYHEVKSVLDPTLEESLGLWQELRQFPQWIRVAIHDPSQRYPVDALTLYFDDKGRLFCVAISAFGGPQVTIGGVRLVGQVPSKVEDDFGQYVEAIDVDLTYNQNDDPSSRSLGLVIRAQRVKDVVLSRPVFVGKEWAETCTDVDDGSIPSVEWNVH